MPEEEQKQPHTLDELEKELDDDKRKPQVVSQDSQPDAGETPVDDPDTITVSDEELKAATEGDEDDDEYEPALDADNSVHLEERNVQRPPFFKRPKFWLLTAAVLVVALLLAWFIRPSRIFLVNLVGLRTNVTVTTMTLPEEGQVSAVVKKVTVTVGGDTITTNDEGQATSRQPFGTVTIGGQKSGYEPASATTLLDFDPFFHLLGGKSADAQARSVKLELKAVGLPLKFTAVDWLSGQPVTRGSFAVGDIVAKPDDQGVVNLRLPASEAKKITIVSHLGGAYIDKQFELDLGTFQTISFVPQGSHMFISKRSGSLEAYLSPVDGSDATVIMKSSSSETAAMNVTYNPSRTYAVLTTTRDGTRDSQNTLLQKMYVLNLANKKLTSVDAGQWFNFVDWTGDTLVYTVGERLSGKTYNTQRLASVDVTNASKRDLSTAANFGQVRVALGTVVYWHGFVSDEDGYLTGPELRTVSVKGGTEKNLAYSLKQLTQTSPDSFAYQTGSGDWHEYNANTGQVKNSSPPASANRAYLASPSADGQWRLVIDRIDGLPTLLVRNVASGKENKLYASASIRGPLHWVGNNVVFRMADGGQTADYIVSMLGGTPKKIADISLPVNPFLAPADYFTLN